MNSNLLQTWHTLISFEFTLSRFRIGTILAKQECHAHYVPVWLFSKVLSNKSTVSLLQKGLKEKKIKYFTLEVNSVTGKT